MVEQIIEQIKCTLTDSGIDYHKVIDELGQVKAYEDRSRGKSFDIQEHI